MAFLLILGVSFRTYSINLQPGLCCPMEKVRSCDPQHPSGALCAGHGHRAHIRSCDLSRRLEGGSRGTLPRRTHKASHGDTIQIWEAGGHLGVEGDNPGVEEGGIKQSHDTKDAFRRECHLDPKCQYK